MTKGTNAAMGGSLLSLTTECVLIDDRRDHCSDYWRVPIVTEYVFIDACNRDEKEEKCVARREGVSERKKNSSRNHVSVRSIHTDRNCSI